MHRARASLLESHGQRRFQFLRQIEHVLHGEVLPQIGAERLRAVRILLPARTIRAHARVAAQDAAVGVDQQHRMLVGQHKRLEEVDRGQQSARLRAGAMQVVRQRNADTAQLKGALRQYGKRAVDVHRAVVLPCAIEVGHRHARVRLHDGAIVLEPVDAHRLLLVGDQGGVSGAHLLFARERAERARVHRQRRQKLEHEVLAVHQRHVAAQHFLQELHHRHRRFERCRKTLPLLFQQSKVLLGEIARPRVHAGGAASKP